MQMHNEQITFTCSKKTEKLVKRERMSSFNTLNEKDINRIGALLSLYFIEILEIQQNVTREDASQVINQIPDWFGIPLNPIQNKRINKMNQMMYQNNQFIYQQQQIQQYVPNQMIQQPAVYNATYPKHQWKHILLFQ